MNNYLPTELIELVVSKTKGNLLQFERLGLSEYYLRKLIKHRRLCDLIDIHGNSNSVKYLHSLKFNFTTDDLEMAAAVGNLDLVVYLHETVGVECTPDSFDFAAEGNFLEIVKYIYSVGVIGSQAALEVAESRDYDDLLDFLYTIEEYEGELINDMGFRWRWEVYMQWN